jgi:2'-5' RNA ligase
MTEGRMTEGQRHSLRSFVAIPLPEKIRSELVATAEEMSRELSGVNWSRKVENLHITVKFLGQVAEERIDEVGAALARAAGTLPRFEMEVRGLGAFPSARRARVIWVGAAAGEGRLAQVAQTVEDVAAQLGIGERETRPFQGHVTLGRAKAKSRRGVDAGAALARFGSRAFGSVEISELHLYESRLGRDGSTYILRSRAALGPN